MRKVETRDYLSRCCHLLAIVSVMCIFFCDGCVSNPKGVEYWLKRYCSGRTFSERKESVLKLVSMGWDPGRRRLGDVFIDKYWRKPSLHISGGWHTEWHSDGEEEVFVEPLVIDARPVTKEEYWTFMKLSGYISVRGKEFLWFLDEMLDEMPEDMKVRWCQDKDLPMNAPHKVGGNYADQPFESCYEDNQAFAHWVGMRMPTQAELEMAWESIWPDGRSYGFVCVRSPAVAKEVRRKKFPDPNSEKE